MIDEPMQWSRVRWTSWTVEPHPFSRRAALKVKYTLIDGTESVEWRVPTDDEQSIAFYHWRVWWARRSQVSAPHSPWQALEYQRDGYVASTARILHRKDDAKRYVCHEDISIPPDPSTVRFQQYRHG
jgi:hypothetical protein